MNQQKKQKLWLLRKKDLKKKGIWFCVGGAGCCQQERKKSSRNPIQRNPSCGWKRKKKGYARNLFQKQIFFPQCAWMIMMMSWRRWKSWCCWCWWRWWWCWWWWCWWWWWERFYHLKSEHINVRGFLIRLRPWLNGVSVKLFRAYACSLRNNFITTIWNTPFSPVQPCEF